MDDRLRSKDVVLLITTLLFVGWTVAGCTFTPLLPAAVPDEDPPNLLPRPLYFIDDTGGQLMRMERDGVTILQVTHEGARIDDFAVSSVDGTLAVVSNHMLIQSDSLGNNRIVKVIDQAEERSLHSRELSNPFFSPDGSQIAFALRGLNFIATGESTSYRTAIADSENPLATALAFFGPTDGWSPDGTQLWIEINGLGSVNVGGLFDLAHNEYREPIGDYPYPPSGGAIWNNNGEFFITPWHLTKVNAETMESKLLDESWKTGAMPLATDLVLTDDGRWIGLIKTSHAEGSGLIEISPDTAEFQWITRTAPFNTGMLAPQAEGAVLVIPESDSGENDDTVDRLFWWPVGADEAVPLALGGRISAWHPTLAWGVE